MAAPDRKGVRHRKKGPPQDGSGDFVQPPPQKAVTKETRFKRLFGFDLEELQSWSGFVQLLNRPADPANLGVLRFLFGFLMVLDIMQERGMSNLDVRFGDIDMCFFPLFNFLQPPYIDWLYIVYLVMLIGALGIMLGFCFRLSCLCFLGPYWFIFFLDKTAWNNHSYLYGLTSFLLLMSDANRYWSIDGLLNKKLRNSHVPLWNYTLLRFQIFIVYFIAGLKKLDEDWVTGHSMTKLSKHWVFSPFTLFLSEEFVSYWMVHMGGLIIDLTMGYLLFFDFTRPIGFFFGGSFHAMNSQLFHIGMFSYTMLATLPLFSSQDWPKRLVHKCPDRIKVVLPLDTPAQDSRRCLYTRDLKEDPQAKTGKQKKPPTRLIHHLSAVFVLLYMSEQLFLPYSHFITQGYNSWTQGLYGYSWDMMVHTWSVQHIKVKYVDAATGEHGYLRPGVFTASSRWSSHPDMLKQYATCLQQRLQEHNISQPQFYFDIWKSMNNRFQQRMVDPRVDIVTADWSPFSPSSWMMPLLVDLTPWREKFQEIEETMANETEVVFVADFPGLELENYINEDFDNVSLTVLFGEVRVEFKGKENNESLKNVTLKKDDKLEIPSGEFHNVLTTSESPSCYFYISTNQTEVEFNKNMAEYLERQNTSSSSTDENTGTVNESSDDPLIQKYQKIAERKKRRERWNTLSQLDYFKVWGFQKYFIFRRSLLMGGLAVRNVVFGTPDVEQLAKDIHWATGHFNPETYLDQLAGVEMVDNPDNP
ncbi:PREDICTED: vitamin K-dependent gamma-carboxylase-like isoform X2 [Branchiostoma belcheri]|uniref:Vitamin K-dependent gamma-carboxylase n=1 Tax=Branchiostoma belcheri TaxID=7741 RepID=A0A6P4Z5S5_BRABE|nr:PREDICTED: vitamin K-dependent gamma-carboxylase-like isoform X2 [Branchiostoma belcheri]